MTSTEAAAAIAILRDAYPRQPFPDGAVRFYALKLADMTGGELLNAVDRLTNRMAFLPSVAEIRLEVAEARLGLPDVTEAWEIAAHGSLKNAPEPVRRAAEFVGGRWAILYSDNITAVRAQFREQYTGLRTQALLAEAGALPERPALPATVERAALPSTDEPYVPSPVMARAARELAGIPLDPPTDAEMADAIRIMQPGPMMGDPEQDYLYKAAELVLVHADRREEE